MATESGAYDGAYSFGTRFGDDPEELIAAAHAGCFSMAFANELDRAGDISESVSSSASVCLEDGEITLIHLETEATVPDVERETFREIATEAKEDCPVSQALAAVDKITPGATLA